MEEAISVSLNSIQPPREDRGGASTSRKTDVKYLQTKAMQEALSPRLKKRGPIEAECLLCDFCVAQLPLHA